MEKLITIPEAKWKRLESFMKMLEEHFTGQLHTIEWLSEELFKEKTGINTKEKLRVFRKEYPELWKARKSYTVERNEKTHTINRGFLYNYTGFLLVHHSAKSA